MPRLPALHPRKVVAALKQSGFVEASQRGSHLHLFHAGRKRMVTVPMHAKDVKRGTLQSIIRQSGLTVEEFLKLL